MQRLDRERLLQAPLPVAHEIQTRFSDADLQGHINNVATVELLQEGRVRFNRHVGLHLLRDHHGVMVAGIQVEYAAELDWMEPVTSHCGVLSIGRTSYTIGQVLLQGGKPGTFAETTLVIVGPDGPSELPPDFRAALEAELVE